LVNEELVGLISELAREVGNSDEIDFGTLDIDEVSAYNLMANNVLEKYSAIKDNELVMMATITHLLVQNFILNLRSDKR
jgi:hypothetical protein